MTTICSDGHIVAADGLVTAGSEIIARNGVKVRAHADSVLGLVGPAALFDVLETWWDFGVGLPTAKDAPPGEWMLLDFRKGSVDVYTSDAPYPHRRAYPVAFGSGDMTALQALRMGASPERAIQWAAETDVFTGGEITSLPIAQALSVAAE